MPQSQKKQSLQRAVLQLIPNCTTPARACASAWSQQIQEAISLVRYPSRAGSLFVDPSMLKAPLLRLWISIADQFSCAERRLGRRHMLNGDHSFRKTRQTQAVSSDATRAIIRVLQQNLLRVAKLYVPAGVRKLDRKR